ncbi:AAA family ATPase [Aliarcobacter butzleri]|uniref:AAA family ATPase n=1 Tax=Aliarcobacter butzleri TaxID=28197 RepID=UPI0021B2CA41|nr:AAA family ATPase [Aliarcobacter butzleri]MCT7594247.1 AAA family ATPase [Aliarcobacter butzleri]MCT7598870.1 AAA family ATPase [Aliarcobacter butzleri]MCT7652806.1 AAA family ATPase [Aliarcobacter butzleri]
MSDLIQKIQNKIDRQNKIPKLIQKINHLLEEQKHILNENDIKELESEKLKLEDELIIANLSLEEKHKNFFYTYDDITNAPDISWLIENMIPKQSIGVLIGASGVGKSTLSLNCSEKILKSNPDVFIIFIDGDMALNKAKEMGIDKLLNKYGDRFKYAGKTTNYFSDSAQKLLKDISLEQEKYPDRTYFVIEDSLSLVAKKSRGFIDTNELYKYEKILRQHKGCSLIIHHKNKAGIFADSQQIENYADYTYEIERNDFNSCIVLHPRKASRFDIQGKAFLTIDRKIVDEIDYENANIDFRESQFVHTIIDLLEDGEMNQSEILNHLEKIRFFSEFKVGQKKAIRWLREWSDKGKWKCEQRVSEKNSIFYWLDIKSESEKLAKLPSDDFKGR